MSTLKVDTILKRTGTGTITVGQSGDTIALPSATLTTALPVASGGTGGTSFSAAGLSNTPAFEVVRNGNQTLTNNTVTKINFDSEQFDSDNAYDNSTNYRFTVPSEKAGKYYVYLKAGIEGASNSNFQYGSLRIRKNGTDIREEWIDARSGGLRFITLSLNTTLDLAVGDYLEAYAYGNLSSGDPDIKADRGSGMKISVFGGYRILGA